MGNKELTRVINVKITTIEQTDENMTNVKPKDAVAAILTDYLLDVVGVDNVNVEVQDFIMDRKAEVTE